MREIKFRALAPDKKGNLKWFDDVITDGQEVWVKTKHLGIKHLKDIKALVQYTCLKDKNGVEICEGDVVKYCDETFEIVYNTITASFILKGHSQDDDWSLGGKGWKRVEVIGNIYENSNLLGENIEQN